MSNTTPLLSGEELKKERGILFKGEMVLATLDGRKTQTRRLIKGTNGELGPLGGLGFPHPKHRGTIDYKGGAPLLAMCPYGQRGERMWVRENWAHANDLRSVDAGLGALLGNPFYQSDVPSGLYHDDGTRMRWRPSIHMPRWASRITRDILNVRVQRVQDITEADAIAEGLACLTKDGKSYKYGIPDSDGLPGNDNYGWHWHEWETSPVDAFAKYWDTLATDGTRWSDNPWVWAITFSASPSRTTGGLNGQ